VKTKFYSDITSVEVILPEETRLKICIKHRWIWHTWVLRKTDKKVFKAASKQFIHKIKAKAILLAGADLALVYHASNVDFTRVDRPEIQAQKLFNFHQK
jgi:hypothetical protein